jgi:hypothetical protein
MNAASVLRLTRWLVPAALGAALFAASTDASAAPVAGADGKRFRLHGEFDVLSFYHYNPDGPGPNYNGGGFGIGRTNLIDAGGAVGGAILHPRPVWSLGFGFLFADYRALLGFKVAFAVDGFGDDDHNDASDPAVTLVSGQLVPYFRWMFLPGKRFRPFIDVHVGFGGGAFVTDNSFTDAHSTTSQIWPNVGTGGGVHIFVIDAFSVDLGLMFDYFAPFSATDIRGPGPDQNEDFQKQGDLLDVSAQAGMSVWF